MTVEKEAPAAATPDVDVSALKNELLSLKALIDRAKEDPDEALSLAGYDFDRYTEEVVKGARRPKTKEEREKAKEASEIEKLRRRVAEIDEKEAKAQAKAQYDAEVAKLLEELIEDEFPVIRSLGLEHSVMGRKLEKLAKGEAVDVKALAKEIEDAVLGDATKLLKHQKVRPRVFADKELVESIKADLGVTTAQAKKIVEKVGAVVTKAAASEAKDDAKAPPAKRREDGPKEGTISKWLSTRSKRYAED